MSSRKRFTASGMVLGLATVLILAACESDDSTDAGGADDPGGGTVNEQDDSQQGRDTAPDLESALAKISGLSQASVQVVYQWQGPGVAGDARFTIAHDPPHFAQLVESDEGQFLLISAEETTICVNDGSGWMCLGEDLGIPGMDIEQMLPDIYDSDDLDALDLQPEDTEVTHDTILGRTAICIVTAQVDQGVTDAEVCFDEQTGTMLRTTGSHPDGAFSLEAIEIGDPDPDLFVPPAAPMQMP